MAQAQEPISNIRLPDGTPTEAQAGDEYVWHRQSGTMTLRRPGIGRLITDPPEVTVEGVTSDTYTAEQIEEMLTFAISFAPGLLSLEFASNDGYEVVYRIIRLPHEVPTPFCLPDGRPTMLVAGDEIFWDPEELVLEIIRKSKDGDPTPIGIQTAEGEVVSLTSLLSTQVAPDEVASITPETLSLSIKIVLATLGIPLSPTQVQEGTITRFILE